MEEMKIIPADLHNRLVSEAFAKRGFNEQECAAAARLTEMASAHGICTHNAIKALHLDELFGSGADPQGCIPNAKIEELPPRFPASETWKAHYKFGPSVGFAAMERAVELAEEHGIGQVSVDYAFHYLWGGGYVMEAAKQGYIAYSNCTASLAEVVPFGGKFPTLGTNPHSWGLPTTDAIGYPVVIDWATSVTAMGRVQQFKREGKNLPENSAVDEQGNATTDPDKVAALLPFGAHKGYGLSLLNELMAAFMGGSSPTLRSKPAGRENPAEKNSCNFYFQAIHPEALSSGSFAHNRNQLSNVSAVIEDILGHGNENCLLPGQLEAQAAEQCQKAGGLLFSQAEVDAFTSLADQCGLLAEWNETEFATYV